MSDNINPDHYKRLPAEAIEIIESAIDKAPSAQDAYLHGQVLKYVLRCWNKNGIEDLKKAKWYLDRLVDSLDEYETQKAADLQSLKDHPFGRLKEPAIKQSLTTEPPDGWRFLEVGEVIRKGDQGFEKGLLHAIEPMKIGMTLQAHWMPTIRRNRFEVGEKVVAKDRSGIWEVTSIINGVYQLKNDQGFFASFPEHLAPYIEDAK